MRIIIFLIFLFFSFQVNSQNVLELTNTEKGKTRIIKSGAKLFFKTKYDSSFVKGKIMQIKDSVLVIYLLDYEDGTPVADVPIKDLIQIEKATSVHAISRTVGKVALTGGGILLFSGVIGSLRKDDFQGQSTNDPKATRTLIASGAILTIAGAIPHIIKPKVYDFRKGWKIQVKKLPKD